MSEMVERVARAMFEDDQFDYEPKMPTWEETGVREEYRRKARIAIGAMREPTVAMRACFIRFLSEDLDYDEMYRRMIDVALANPDWLREFDPSNTTSL